MVFRINSLTFIAKVTVAIGFFYHCQTSPISLHKYANNLWDAIHHKTSKQSSNPTLLRKITDIKQDKILSYVVPILITTAVCAGAIVIGKLLYRFVNKPDEYFLDWANTIVADLQKDETRLVQLSKCSDEGAIVDILLELVQSGDNSKNMLELSDKQLKKHEADILKITIALEKRIRKPGKRNLEAIKAIEDCRNNLNVWLPLVTTARKSIEKYGCYVELFQLCEKLSKNYDKELRCIETSFSEKRPETIEKIVDTIHDTTYDLHAHTLITDILELGKKLDQCGDNTIKQQWTKTANALLERLNKLALVLIVSYRYLDSIKETLRKEFWRGYISNIHVPCSYNHYYHTTPYTPTYPNTYWH